MNYLGAKPVANPENVAKAAERIADLWKRKYRKNYSKVVDGKKLFIQATNSIEAIYADDCPHFNMLADWLRVQP